MGQAKDYAGKLAIRYTYASNGQGIYGIDMDTGDEGGVLAFPTPDELWHRTHVTHNIWRDRFAAVPFEDRGGYFQGRYYQDIAIERVLAAIADQKQRILLTLATAGTGKTFIAFKLAWKLFNSRGNLTDWHKEGQPTRRPPSCSWLTGITWPTKRIKPFRPFLRMHRYVLFRQTSVKGKVPKNGSIFFTIFQTFMSGPMKIAPSIDIKLHLFQYKNTAIWQMNTHCFIVIISVYQ